MPRPQLPMSTIRFICQLKSTPRRNPTLYVRILSSSYPTLHCNSPLSSPIDCCSTYKDLVLIPLRAIFGGDPCPSECGIISETTTDLANHILNHKDWDPTKIQSPNQPKILPPKLLDPSISFGQAKPMMVDVSQILNRIVIRFRVK